MLKRNISYYIRGIILYYRVLVDNDLVRVLINISHTNLLVNIGFTKDIGRYLLCKKIPIDEGLIMSISEAFITK